jgi:Rrf2 family nitric oxide-sensitive transcriptional repressor
LSVRQIAEALSESPTYLAKVTRHLAKAGLLRVHFGVRGGAVLNRSPETITLRAVVEACQGAIRPDFCQETESLDKTCAFHVAVAELHQAIVDVLSRWTLEDLLERPGPCGRLRRKVSCLITPPATESVNASRKASVRRRPSTREAARAGRQVKKHDA